MNTAARRALVRWSVRLFRREWRQQLLVLVLLVVAVTATVGGIALAVNASGSQSAERGAANKILSLTGSTASSDVAADVAAARAAFGVAEPVAHQKLTVPGTVAALDTRDQDPSGALGHGMLRLAAGRYPAGPGEVALTDGASSVLDARIGASIAVGGRSRTVVGTVENPYRLSDEFVLVAPGQLDHPDQTAILVDATDAQLRGFHMPDGSGLAIQAYSKVAAAQAAAIVLAISTVGMLFVGLLCVAGFAVLAQRHLRSLGMLGAIGAIERQVRLVMLASGAVVGVVGAAIGTAIGLADWFAFAGRLEPVLDHRIARFDLPWGSLAATLALAVVTAVGAAWSPARAAGRMPVVAALSGRPPRPRPSHRFATTGVAPVAAGYTMIVITHQHQPALIVGGTLAITVGVLFLAPLAIRSIGVLARRSPISIRLAVRDLVRYQSRSSAALGAAALALGIAATVAIGSAAAPAADQRSASLGNLRDNELVVYTGRRAGPAPVLSATTPYKRPRPGSNRSSPPSARPRRVALQPAISARAPDLADQSGTGSGKLPAGLVKVTRGPNNITGAEFLDRLYVATPQVLRYISIDPATVDPTADVLTTKRDVSGLEVGAGLRQTLVPTYAHLDLPAYTSEPTTLITTSSLQKLDLGTTTVAWALRTPAPLTNAQITAARRAAAAAGLSIETRSPGPSYQQARTDATAIGMLVALGVLAMTVGLIRAETAGDTRTLSATAPAAAPDAPSSAPPQARSGSSAPCSARSAPTPPSWPGAAASSPHSDTHQPSSY